MKFKMINESCQVKECKKLPEDFDEANLDKRGTAEHEANAKRLKRIEMYRDLANLGPDEAITEDNIDEWALSRLSAVSNRGVDQLMAELLGKDWSGYEI